MNQKAQCHDGAELENYPHIGKSYMVWSNHMQNIGVLPPSDTMEVCTIILFVNQIH